MSEAAIAAGVPRIEAVAGLESFTGAVADAERLKALAAKLNSPLAELEKKLDATLAQQKALEKQLAALKQKQAAGVAAELLEKVRNAGLKAPAIIENLGDADGDYLQAVADALKGRFDGVVVLAGAANDAVALVATVAPAHYEAIQAGKIIQTIAPIVGGKGGGRPDNARGGGKDAAKYRRRARRGGAPARLRVTAFSRRVRRWHDDDRCVRALEHARHHAAREEVVNRPWRASQAR